MTSYVSHFSSNLNFLPSIEHNSKEIDDRTLIEGLKNGLKPAKHSYIRVKNGSKVVNKCLKMVKNVFKQIKIDYESK